jgi:hypothetical protein
VTTEANLWEWLRDVTLPLGHYTRIESECSPGFPDVFCTIPDIPTFTMELKAAKDSHAHHPFTKKTGMRRSQLKWIPKEVAAGGTVWILVEIGRKVYIIAGMNVKYINYHTEEEIASIAVAMLTRGKNQQAAKILHEILSRGDGI